MRIVVLLLVMLMASPVWAADWTVQRVRGVVTQKIGASWVAVARGDTIAGNRYLKTGGDGRVGLARGRETIELEGNTQIRIKDAGAELMTTVLQDFGTVAIEAERRNVQHFSVQTKYLAAVVKGTRFVVRADAQGASVSVSRGVVQVQDSKRDLVSDVRPGQSASAGKTTALVVEGPGAGAVFTFKGVEVEPGTTTPKAEAAAASGKSATAPGATVSAAVAGKAGNTGNGVGATVSASVQAVKATASQTGSSVGGAVSGTVQNVSAAVGQTSAGIGAAVSSVVSNGHGSGNGNGNANGNGSSVVETVTNTVSATTGGLGKTLGGLLR